MRLSTMLRHTLGVTAAAAAGWLLATAAMPAAAQSRGQLLYVTHCIACHDTQVHWRDKKQVVDWPSLRAQVRLWQDTARLEWSDDDIEQVAQYLDAAYYRLKRPVLRGSAPAKRALALATGG